MPKKLRKFKKPLQAWYGLKVPMRDYEESSKEEISRVIQPYLADESLLNDLLKEANGAVQVLWYRADYRNDKYQGEKEKARFIETFRLEHQPVFGKTSFNNLKKAFSKLNNLLSDAENDMRGLNLLKVYFQEYPQDHEHCRKEFETLGLQINLNEVGSINQIIEHLRRTTEATLDVLKPLSYETKKHRSQDTELLKAIHKLCEIYHRHTSKIVGADGICTRFVEACIIPIEIITNDQITYYIKKILKNPHLAHSLRTGTEKSEKSRVITGEG
jgi:hypothetical protein